MNQDQRQYFERAKSWALDEQATLRSALRHARLFAGVVAVIAILEAFALLLLTPLKTVTAIPVLVDRQTGYVETLRPDGRTQLRADEALTRSLLAQYVIARESFDITALGAEYRKVALWSGGQARQEYLALMPASNPQSPLRIYPRSTLVETRIKSISPMGPNTALVRFETRRFDQDGHSRPAPAWAAIVAYRYSDAALSVEDRLVNPLGFQVMRYHKDAETLPPEPAPAIQPSAPAPVVASTPAAAPSVTGLIAPPAASPTSPAATLQTGPNFQPGRQPPPSALVRR